jgi:hypothetical protein
MGDETWILVGNAETIERSKQWMHARSPKKLKNFKQTLHAC